LDQADTVAKACLADHHQARQEYGELVERVKAGKVSTIDAARHLHGWLPWEPWQPAPENPTPARLLADQVAEDLRRAAEGRARADGWDVHKALGKLADAAVKRAVKAGRELVDVRAVKAAVEVTSSRYAQYAKTTWAAAGRHPEPPEVVPLPSVSLDRIQGDARRLHCWAEATDAVAAFQAVHEVAGVLHRLLGGRSVMFVGDVDPNCRDLVAERLPEQVHLAVADALGWKPGLHVPLKPTRPRPPEEREPMSWIPSPVLLPNGTRLA
jgi:hypothetical protein